MTALMQTELSKHLRLVASGEVRETYELDDSTLHFARLYLKST